jgi:hypothetical protein
MWHGVASRKIKTRVEHNRSHVCPQLLLQAFRDEPLAIFGTETKWMWF